MLLLNEFSSKIYTRIKKALVSYDLFKLILKYGGEYINVTALINKYGEKAMDKLLHDPYKYGIIAGLTFITCEKLAIKSGIVNIGLINFSMKIT